jgi:hypothetical protein
MYRQVFWKSLKNLRIALFIPDFYFMFIELILAFLFYRFTGISVLFENPDFMAASIEAKLPLIQLFVSSNLVSILFYLLIFVLTSFILGASLNCMRFGMIRDVVKGNKFSFKQVVGYGIRFWSVVAVRMILFGLGILAFLFISGSFMILQTYYPGVPTVVVVTGLGFAAVFFLKLLFLFAYAIMFLEKKGAFAAVRDSFVYFFRNKDYVIKVFMIVMVLSVVLFPFEYAFIRYKNMFGLVSLYAIAFLVVRNLASSFYTVWSELLIFYSYDAKALSPSGPSQQQSP